MVAESPKVTRFIEVLQTISLPLSSAPIATGWSDSCRAGFTPAEGRCLSTAHRKREWELPHLEYRDLEDDDPNFLEVKDSPDQGYRILIDKSQEEIVAKLGELKATIENGDLRPWEFRGMKASNSR